MSWLELETIFFDAARAATGLAANWLIQSTLLIAGGLAVGCILRKRGSAVQSAVYRTTLVAVLVCPLATCVLSLLGVTGWSLAMPSAYSTVSIAAPGDRVATPDAAPAAEIPVDPAPAISQEPLGFRPPGAPRFHPLPGNSDDPARRDVPGESIEAAPQSPVIVADELNDKPAVNIYYFGVLSIAIGVAWLSVGLCLLTRLAIAWKQLHRLRRGARAADSRTIESCREIAAQLQVSPPEVLHSPFLPSPCLAGLRRPAVMLPEAELSLPVRDVLVHELAHLLRNDCFWNLIRRAATAVLFFQPLMWKLSRRLAATAEEVCDDYVVQLGGDRREYAHRLVDIATLSLAPVAAAGVGIVSLRSMLAARVSRIMDTSRSLSTRVGNLLLAIVLLTGLTATLLVGFVGLRPAPIEANAAARSADDVKSNDSGDTVAPNEVSTDTIENDVLTVTGRVVDPSGAPVAGADLYALRWFWNFGQPKPLAQSKSDANGHFTVTYRKSQFFETGSRIEQWKEAKIVAFAKGFGFGWVTYEDIPAGNDATLKLVADDVPIEGRVLDLEGKPVAGASVAVEHVNCSKNENLDAWLKAVRARESVTAASEFVKETVPLSSASRWQGIKTDQDGRFRLVGIGRERQAIVRVEGPTIVTRTLAVVTRPIEPIAQPASDYNGVQERLNYGARFEYMAAPSWIIEGVVRDAKSGEPIAGVEIWSRRFADDQMAGNPTIKTKTDEKGRYRIAGMPKGAGNELYVVPADLPYFTSEFKVPDPPGMDPVALDMEIHRGVWVTGHVTDKDTNRPVSAVMYYIAPPDNPLVEVLPEFARGVHIRHVQDRYRTKPDGSYRVVALPGRGIIGVGAVTDTYPGGQGWSDVPGVENSDRFIKYNGAVTPTKKYPTAIKEVQIASESESPVCDFVLETGMQVTVRAVDPNGGPVNGFSVNGDRTTQNRFKKIPGPEFDVVGLRDDESRTLLLHDEIRRLGKATRINAADATGGPISIHLEPCATVIGQLVSQDGEPLRGANVRIDVDGDHDYRKGLESKKTNSDGRFRHDGFLPGLTYTINVDGPKVKFATLSKNLQVHPGETIDLGTIDITSKSRPAIMRVATSSKSADKSTQIVKGQVLSPDGKPVAGATVVADWVFLGDENPALTRESSQRVQHAILAKTTSDAAGKFELKFSGQPPRENQVNEGWHVVAFAPGMGPAWSRDVRVIKSETTTLQLTRDESVRGRIVDLEGKPIAGVNVRIHELRPAKNDQAILDWIAEAKSKPRPPDMAAMVTMEGGVLQLPAPFPYDWDDGGLAGGSPALPTNLQTDNDGKFKINNVGQNRLLILQLDSLNVAKTYVPVVTRQMQPLAARQAPDIGMRSAMYYGRDFELVAEPTQLIEGSITDTETRKPIANCPIRLNQFRGNLLSQSDFLTTRTDEQGNYKLVGAPQGGGHRIEAVPAPDQPYFPTDKRLRAVPDSFDPIRCDFKLRRGKWIVGKLSERGSGKPVADTVVEYLPLRSNPHAKDFTNYDPQISGAPSERFQTDKDGRFRVLGIPGAGILAAIAQQEDRSVYTCMTGDQLPKHLVGERGEPTTYHPWTVTGYNALKEIQLSESSEDASYNLELTRGATRRLKLVDASGQPVKGVQVLGSGFSQTYLEKPLVEPAVELTGLGETEQRLVVLLHPERRIGRVMLLTKGDELIVELQPCAVVRGRFLDQDGQPIQNAAVNISIRRPDNWGRGLNPLTTDAAGRFEAVLPPGFKFDIWHYEPDKGPNFSAECETTPGAVFELGDLKDGTKLKAEQTAKLVAATNRTNGLRGSERAAADNVTATTKNQIRGHVVGADDKPVAGAKIYWITWSLRGDQPEPQLAGTANENGDFQFASLETKLVKGVASDLEKNYQLVVVAPGHGMAFLSPHDLRPADALAAIADALRNGNKPATIKLPVDASVKIHVVNVDGQPVPNVRASVRGITDIKPVRDESARKELEAHGADKATIDWRIRTYELINRFWPAKLRFVAPSAKSGADGWLELRGLGADRLVQLLVEGDGVTSSIVLARTQPGQAITIKSAPGFADRSDTLYGPEFTHVVAPSKPVEGRVLDIDTGQPLAGAVVRTYRIRGDRLASTRGREYLATVSDPQGRYRINGLPLGKENGLVAFTTGDEPYVPIGHSVNTDVATPSATQEFSLKRGVWAEGRIYDAATKKPLAGQLGYYLFRNPELERAIPGLKEAFMDEQYFTDPDGKFRVPVLASRGILAFNYSPSGSQPEIRYPRGTGADKIAGGTAMGGSPSFPTLPYYLMAGNYEAVVEVAPKPDQKTINFDIPLSTGGQITVQVVDEAGKPVIGLEFYGEMDNSGWRHGKGPQCEVKNLVQGKPRKLFFFHRARNLVGAATVDNTTADGLVVKLSPGGGIRGRLVNEDGEPIAGASLLPSLEDLWNKPDAAIWPADPKLSANPTNIPVDSNARFEILGLIPGKSYRGWSSAPRKENGQMMDMGIGELFGDVKIEAGKTLDLGDVQPKTRKPKPKDAKTKPIQKSSKPGAKPDVKKSALTSPGTMQISGRITGPDKKPVAGANVALLGGHRRYHRGGDWGSTNPVLAQTTTNANGEYNLGASGVSSKNFWSLEVLAMSKQLGTAGRELNPDDSKIEASFELAPEQLMRGRLMDIDGRPVAGARMTITSIARTITTGDYPTRSAWIEAESTLPTGWPAPLATGDDGRFTIHQVAAGDGVFISIDGNDQIGPQDIAINSGMKERREKTDGTFRPLVKNVKPGEEAIFALVPAQIFEGTVTYEDTGKPAAGARLLAYASQGSASWSAPTPTMADARGRFTLRPYAGVSFDLMAYPSEGAGYLSKALPTIEWKDAARRKQVDIKLNRGVLVQGTVVETKTGKPVAGASIQYYSEQENNPNSGHGALAGDQASQLSDDAGKFQITVIPGPGRLLVHAPSTDFVVKETSAGEITSGNPGGEPYYVHAIERINPPLGAATLDVVVKLQRSKIVVGRLIDEQGRPIKDAMIISKLSIHPFSLDWTPQTSLHAHDGVFELSGFAPGKEYDVYFLDAKNRLGATAKLKSGDASPTITLKPCGQAIAHFKYRDGKPVADYRPMPEFVMGAGVDHLGMAGSMIKKMGVPATEADYVSNVDKTNWQPWPSTDKTGQVTFPALIPGATYRVRPDINLDFLSARLFSVQPGQTLDLGEFVLDKEE